MSYFLFLGMPAHGHFDWGGITDTLHHLQKHGHNVTVSTGYEFENFFKSKGFDFLSLSIPSIRSRNVDTERDSVASDMTHWFFHEEYLDEAVKKLTEFSSSQGIDAILSEPMFHSTPIISELTGIPYIVLGKQLPKTASGYSESLQDSLRLSLKQLNNIRKKHNLIATSTLLINISSPLLNIIYSVPEFDQSNKNGIFVGGERIKKKSVRSPALKQILASPNPILLCTSGTVFYSQHLFDSFLELEKKYAVILATGSQLSLNTHSSANLYITDFIDYHEVGSMVDLFITNCGTGTINMAIRSGKPIIGVPLMGQQMEYAKKCEGYGNGIYIPYQNLSYETLQTAVEKILNSGSYKKRALTLQKAYKKLGGSQKAAELIENALS